MGGRDTTRHCPACGRPGEPAAAGHPGCAAALELDPPRWCERCGGRLDVQVYPTGYRASCRRCDGVHPARDRIPPTA